MNMYVRGTLFFLVLAGLGAQIFFASKVLLRRFEIETKMANAAVASQKAIAARDAAQQELDTAKRDLLIAKLGWEKEWNFPAGGNVGNVQPVAGGGLNVNGLGRTTGLVPEGNTPPSVQVFVFNDQNQSVYLGEFLAPIQQIADTNCVLFPSWKVQPQELQAWDFSRGVRMRTEIPSSSRRSVESLLQTIQRSEEQIAATNANIAQMLVLIDAANKSLDARKKELLGDPDGPVVAEHPEYRDGLVKALQDLEEERNAVQVAVDELRRLVKTATEKRQESLGTIRENQVAEKAEATRVSQAGSNN